MSVGMLALFTNDTQSYSNIALPSDSPYHHRQSELHNELYFSINIRKNQHHVGERYVVEFFRRDILAKKPEANTFYQKRLNKFLAQS